MGVHHWCCLNDSNWNPAPGTRFTAKRGTAVRGISLVFDNLEHIEGRINGQQIVILSKFVKILTKASVSRFLVDQRIHQINHKLGVLITLRLPPGKPHPGKHIVCSRVVSHAQQACL